MKTARALPILMYHHVSPNPGLVTVSPSMFREHIQALAEAGWRSAGLDEVERFYRGEALPAKTCVITFDDGYLDNYVHAHPVLREFGMKAVLFVVTAWLGDGPARADKEIATPDHNRCKALIGEGNPDAVVVRWSEVEAMIDAGTFEFHSHTHTHTRWDKAIADQKAKAEALQKDLESSRLVLKQRLGSASRHLCWPQGYYDDDYRRVAEQSGFDHLYTTGKRVNKPGSSPMQIGRVVTKERPGAWLVSRVGIYGSPWLGGMYSWLQGKG